MQILEGVQASGEFVMTYFYCEANPVWFSLQNDYLYRFITNDNLVLEFRTEAIGHIITLGLSLLQLLTMLISHIEPYFIYAHLPRVTREIYGLIVSLYFD